MATKALPRRNSGRSGSGGICSMRALVVTSSGAVFVQATHALRISAARSHGHIIMPA